MSGILWLALIVAIAVAIYQIVEWIMKRINIQPMDEGDRSGGFQDVIDFLRERFDHRDPPQNS